MSHSRTSIIILILLGLISALSAIAGNIASSILPEPWKPFLWLAWPLFSIFIFASIVLAIWQHHLEKQATPSIKFTQARKLHLHSFNPRYPKPPTFPYFIPPPHPL